MNNAILCTMNNPHKLKYHHLGIPTNKPIEGEVYLKDYKIYHYGYEKSEYGIEWMRYEADCKILKCLMEANTNSLASRKVSKPLFVLPVSNHKRFFR